MKHLMRMGSDKFLCLYPHFKVDKLVENQKMISNINILSYLYFVHLFDGCCCLKVFQTHFPHRLHMEYL